MKIDKSKFGLVAATFATVLVVAGASGCNSNNSSSGSGSSDASPTSQSSQNGGITKASDLRTVLNGLEKEHVGLAFQTTVDAAQGSPETAGALQALLNNQDELTKAIASVYGDAAGAQFKEIFGTHLGFFKNYAVATKAGDEAGKAKAKQDMKGYADAIGNFFGKANPNLKAETVTALFNQHADIIFAGIDASKSGDYNKQFAQQKLASDQIGAIADNTAAAIVKQMPDKFNGEGKLQVAPPAQG